MRSVTAVLPLLAFAASVFAAPTPLHPRAEPNVHEVIRNPAPVDARFKFEADLLKEHLDVDISTRAVPVVENEIAPIAPVTGRAALFVERAPTII